MKAADRLIIALDMETKEQALAMVRTLCPLVSHFKIGMELFTAEGPDAIRSVQNEGGKVFLDLKYHDIPNTVESAVKRAVDRGVWMLNVHALGGQRMMEAAVKALPKQGVRPLLIAVTVLTSHSQAEWQSDIGCSEEISASVCRLAQLAFDSGLDGVVASAQEAMAIRQKVEKGFCLVTPGIRPAWAEVQDQRRVLTPAKALQAGADYLVVGRPVTGNADPLGAVQKIIEEIS